MISINELEIGTKFYKVKETNLAFHRQKIHRVIDGEDWFKYDTPLREYEIVPYEVVGILRKKLEGEWTSGDDHWETEDEYVVKNLLSDEKYAIQESDCFMDLSGDFYTHEEALAEKAKLEREIREMDMR